jgi:hypothetical protein
MLTFFSDFAYFIGLHAHLLHIQTECPKANRTTRNKEKQTNSVVLVRKRTIPTERPPLLGVVSANSLRIEDVAWSAQRIPTAVFSVF